MLVTTSDVEVVGVESRGVERTYFVSKYARNEITNNIIILPILLVHCTHQVYLI